MRNIQHFIEAMALQFRAGFEIIQLNTILGSKERIESYNTINRDIDSFIAECNHHFKEFNEIEFLKIIRK
jgi:hypothetical protein